MLDTFLRANRDEIIARTRARFTANTGLARAEDIADGIPAFLNQLGTALRLAESSDTVDHRAIRSSSGRHAHDLIRAGLSIAQVVHCYGDVCQVVTELAVQQRAQILGGEFQTLNLCLDDAIAEAVTAFASHRERAINDAGTERLGVLAHELRNLLSTAMMSFEVIKSGRVAAGGSTGQVHLRSLMGVRDLIDRSLAEVRLDAGIEHRERIVVAELIEELEIGALIQAQAREVSFTVARVDRAVAIEGDRQILLAALANLLQNAFKFTPSRGRVSLTMQISADRVCFDVADECGGLPPGALDDLFRPFTQRGGDRSGVGLGLVISRRAAEANGGTLRVHDIPGTGCIFTLDLPRADAMAA